MCRARARSGEQGCGGSTAIERQARRASTDATKTAGSAERGWVAAATAGAVSTMSTRTRAHSAAEPTTTSCMECRVIGFGVFQACAGYLMYHRMLVPASSSGHRAALLLCAGGFAAMGVWRALV